MTPFVVIVYVWPFSGVSDKWTGSRKQQFDIVANDFDDAVIQGNNILVGIRTNPNVWQAGISGIIEGEIS